MLVKIIHKVITDSPTATFLFAYMITNTNIEIKHQKPNEHLYLI